MEPNLNTQAQSCAEMALVETQSLMVNRIAAQYTAVFVLQRQLRHLGTVFMLDPPTAGVA
ncbi:MAG: hypothetical protein IT327_23790 [Anaerolineae bacterium]|nr:hypothetical protein [Anaerolineae bacterium]